MGFFVGLALWTIICAVAGLTLFLALTQFRRLAVAATAIVWVVLAALITVVSSYQQVEAGHVGVVRTFGSITGQIEEGPRWILPWQTVTTQSIQVQKAEFRDPIGEGDVGRVFGRIEAASRETQDVFFNVTLNWNVDARDVQQLHRDYGTNFFDRLAIPSRVQQHVKAEVVKHTAVEATQKREEIRANVIAALAAELNEFSINVASLQIDNISYQAAFSNAIEAKQVATQNALQAQEVVAQREAEARQNIATEEGVAQQTVIKAQAEAERKRIDAQGEADSIRIRAEAQAQANREIAASLTTNLIQYEALQQLDGVDVALLPAGSNLLFDPTTILTK